MRYSEYEELLADSRLDTLEPTGNQHRSNFEDQDFAGLLSKEQKEEEQRIETELKEIESQLENRERIHETATRDLEEDIRQEENRLEQLQRPFPSADELDNQRRRVRELEQRLQEAHRTHWRDSQQLHREKRRLQRELAELKDTNLSAFL